MINETVYRKKSTLREWTESILIAFIIAMIARTFIVQAFKIPTKSMEPTLHGDPRTGDHILVNKYIYYMREPKRGDIIVFRTVNIPGLDYHKDYVKRLVGLPGDHIRYDDDEKVLYVNNEPMTQELMEHVQVEYESYQLFAEQLGEVKHIIRKEDGVFRRFDKEWIVPHNHYFAMGDNRDNSNDSRYWGFVPKENLIGKAMLIYWPLGRMALFKNNQS